jgi:opine dehydrogenase
MKIAVLGGGHGCYAAAADLAEQGHEVMLWRRDAQALAPLLADPTIELIDHAGRRPVRIAGASADIGPVVRGADLIFVPGPAFAQCDIARLAAPWLHDGQVFFLAPGTLGSIAMSRTLHAMGVKARVAFAETGTLPWLCRKPGPAEVRITMRATRLPTGVFPARDSARAFEVLRAAFPAIEPIEDALSGALMNAGPIIHPPLIVMNAGPLEHSDNYDIHNEGTQPAVRRVTDALDAERIAVRQAFGYGPEHFPLRDHYENDRWMYGDSHQRLVESGDWREPIDLRSHRYMREDVEYGLSLLATVASYVGVQAPLAHGLLAIGSTICGGDFLRASPRTFANLGLASLDRQALARLLHEGLPD